MQGLVNRKPNQNLIQLLLKHMKHAKGFGIGALLGLGAVTILSGGAAAPLVMAAYAATTGVAGGMLGKAVEDTNKKDNNDDENEPKE